MKWTSARIYVIKAAIIGTALGYMVLDLWVLNGPLYGFLHKDKQAAAAAAVVYGERISHGQLARHKAEQEAVSGKSKASIAMMMDLVRASLLRMRTRYNDNQLPHDRAAAERAQTVARTSGFRLSAHLHRRGLRFAGRRGLFHREDAVCAAFAVFGLQGGLRPSGEGMARHLRSAGADNQLLEQLRSVSFSGKTDSARNHQLSR